MTPSSQDRIRHIRLRPGRLVAGIAINLAGMFFVATQLAAPALLGAG